MQMCHYTSLAEKETSKKVEKKMKILRGKRTRIKRKMSCQRSMIFFATMLCLDAAARTEKKIEREKKTDEKEINARLMRCQNSASLLPYGFVCCGP